MNSFVRTTLGRFRRSFSRSSPNNTGKRLPPDLDDDFVELYRKNEAILGPFNSKLYTTYQTTKYVIDNNLPGDLVECGVYRGRQVVMMALTMMAFGEETKNIFLYDTFSGMTTPSEFDVKKHRVHASTFEKNLEHNHLMQRGGINLRCYTPIDEVKDAVYASGYPSRRFKFIVGDVLNTLPNNFRTDIALLRLDTDWYESTRHELKHLYDKLTPLGALVIDDYGSWEGQRKAVDEFFQRQKKKPFLARTSRAERVSIKTQFD